MFPLRRLSFWVYVACAERQAGHKQPGEGRREEELHILESFLAIRRSQNESQTFIPFDLEGYSVQDNVVFNLDKNAGSRYS